MKEAALVLFVGEFLGCLLFCILFGLRSRWWTSGMGQNMLAMMFVLTLLQGLSVMRLVLDPVWLTTYAVPLRFWSFLALFIVVWWRVIILIRVQHDDAVRNRAQQRERSVDDTDPDMMDDRERIRD